ncbi:MAG: DNA primase [Proteobacteria bacterium]|nr:MAG: DNA primase [Pseudomonadota bacterium]PIE19396.1 MAG: DNA primase [Pseudomonadota bacterium]
MKGRIPERVIAEIRDRADIVEIIGRHVELKRSGSSFIGLCPFHDEKTPSFNVNAARQFFHCFGCRASGDVIGFLMRVEGREFMDVIEDLAQRVGIELEREEQSPRQAAEDARRRSEKQQGLDLNERVTRLYQRYLLESDVGREARDYIAGRGIDETITERFRLGFAPATGDVVAQRLADHGVDMALAARLGLVAKRRRGEGYHDRFWNRVIFPLMGVSSEVLGFGGRMLGEGDGPKYVNTPETVLYHKGQALYGLAQAATAIRKRGEALLVEGNFDVLQMHQHGFANAVAPMGTALTPQQARMLKRFAQRAVAIFDGDKAGKAAALRSVGVLLEAEIDTHIATLPPGEDPDSLLRGATGGEGERAPALMKVLDAARPGIDYVLAEERSSMEESVPGRARVVERVAKLVGLLKSKVAQQLYVDRLALELSIDRRTVERAVAGERISRQAAAREARAAQRSASDSRRSVSGDPGANAPHTSGAGIPTGGAPRSGVAPATRFDPAELDLLKILLEHPRLFPRAERANLRRLLTSDALRATYAAAASVQAETGRVEIHRLLASADPLVRDAVAQAGTSQAFAGGDPNRALDEWALTALRKRLGRLRKGINTQISRQQQEGGEPHNLLQALVASQELTQRFDRARRSRQLEEAWALVPELIQVEQDIDDTQ